MINAVKNMLACLLRPLFDRLYAEEVFIGRSVRDELASALDGGPLLLETSAVLIGFLSDQGSRDGTMRIGDLHINGKSVGSWKLSASKEILSAREQAVDFHLDSESAQDMAQRLRVYAAVTDSIRITLSAPQARSLARQLELGANAAATCHAEMHGTHKCG